MHTTVAKRLVVLSIALFAVCLFLPDFCWDRAGPNHVSPLAEECSAGFAALLFGVFGLMAPADNPGYWAWIANPLLLASWILIVVRRPKASIVLALISLLFAASFLRIGWVNGGWVGLFITRVEIGYWLWLTSIGVTLVAAVVGAAGAARSTPPQPESLGSSSPGG